MTWGNHIILDAFDCDLEAITNIKIIEVFIDELIEKSNMTKWGELFWMDLKPTDDIGNKDFSEVAGISCCQFITTSNITCHFANKSKSMYLDFFSCKDFDDDVVVELVCKYFSPKTVNHFRCTRGANL